MWNRHVGNFADGTLPAFATPAVCEKLIRAPREARFIRVIQRQEA